MTLVTPSLVFCKVSIVYTSILILLTSLPQTEPQATSTMLSVTRVLPLTTLVCSIAHMFPSRWFVPLERTPSSPRLASRPATVWLPTHSQKEPIKVWVVSRSMQTATIVALQSRTSCDPSFTCHQGPFGVLFLCLQINSQKE